MTADTPNRSRLRTIYTKCSVKPPVSPSRMIGLVVTSMISLIVFNRDEKSTSSVSGFPFIVESHRDDIHIPSNCRIVPCSITVVFSAISPVRPVWASIQTAIPFCSISRRRRPLRISGMDSCERAADSSWSYCSLREYGNSTNLPPYSSKSRMHSSRTGF